MAFWIRRQSVSLTHVSASIGLAIYPDTGKDVETLLQRADYAMYIAKAGHQQYVLADSDIGAMQADATVEEAEHTALSEHADKAVC